MALILNIDTALESATISIADDGKIIESVRNTLQKEQATFLHTAIDALVKKTGVSLKDLDAIAIVSGPGSYTGLRVGMATAKGLCYALNKPLIAINTLELLANAAIQSLPNIKNVLFCPMIDARRMEVFTAIYNYNKEILLQPTALILNENSFLEYLQNSKIYFFGNGAAKWQVICNNVNSLFTIDLDEKNTLAILSNKNFVEKNFANLAYVEPFYLKEFYDSKRL